MLELLCFIAGFVAAAVFARATKNAKPDSALGKVRAVVMGGGGGGGVQEPL